MDASLWNIGEDSWAFCDGPGPMPLRKLVCLHDGVWLIAGNDVKHSNLKAAAVAEGYPTDGLKIYDVKKDGEARSLITYDTVLEILKSQGWTVVGKPVGF